MAKRSKGNSTKKWKNRIIRCWLLALLLWAIAIWREGSWNAEVFSVSFLSAVLTVLGLLFFLCGFLVFLWRKTRLCLILTIVLASFVYFVPSRDSQGMLNRVYSHFKYSWHSVSDFFASSEYDFSDTNISSTIDWPVGNPNSLKKLYTLDKRVSLNHYPPQMVYLLIKTAILYRDLCGDYTPEIVRPDNKRNRWETAVRLDSLQNCKVSALDFKSRLEVEMGEAYILQSRSKENSEILEMRFSPENAARLINNYTRLAANLRGVEHKLLLAIARQESQMGIQILSPVGAMGVMQIMPGTAKHLKVWDPWDIKSNIEGAARYVAELKRRYHGDLVKVVAAYNWGPGNVDRLVKRNPNVPIRQLIVKMPSETRNYIAKVLGK